MPTFDTAAAQSKTGRDPTARANLHQEIAKQHSIAPKGPNKTGGYAEPTTHGPEGAKQTSPGESPAILIGGTADHVHLLFCLSKNYALKKIVEEVKKGSSKWIKTIDPRYREFHWQNGYGAFSVSQSKRETVKRYIENQEEHHRK